MSDELRIEYIPLDEVSRWKRNPKRHDMGTLVAAIERYGFVDPPKWDETLGALVYGNGRDEALEWMHRQGRPAPRGIRVDEAGRWLVPIKFGVDAVSPQEAEALAIDHNNLTMAGGDFTAWDMARMWDASYTEILAGLQVDDALPLSLDNDSLAALLAGVGDEPDIGGAGDDFDGSPAVDGPTRTALGDLWQIGPHRLIVGDCTDPAVIERLMGGERAAMTWADPPFGIEYTGHGESVDGRANKFSPIAGDDAPSGDWLPFWLPKDKGALYLKTTWKVLHEWEQILSEIISIRSRIVWDKCSHVAGDVVGGYATQTEIILFCSIGRHLINVFDTDHWSIPRATTGAPETRSGHPYESPVALIERAVQNSTKRGDVVGDPFLGSGTTIIVAHRTGRRCRGCEIEPKWADVCLSRSEAAGLSCTRVEPTP